MKTVGLILALLFVNSRAFQIVLENKGLVPIVPRVQALGFPDHEDVPDKAGYLFSKTERVYDNANAWLNRPFMAVKEGDTRTMSFVANGADIINCGSVTFKRGTVVTYKHDGTCVTSMMPTIDDETEFLYNIENPKYSWVVDEFRLSPHNERFYARGPNKYVLSGEKVKSIVAFEAVEHNTGELATIKTTVWRPNGCYMHAMNDAVGCQGRFTSALMAGKYDAGINPGLKPGHYSGVAKIRGEQWDQAGNVEFIYLNLEVVKEA